MQDFRSYWRSLRLSLPKFTVLLIFLVAFLLVLISGIPGLKSNPLPTVPSQRSEIRGVWMTNVDSDVLYSRDRLSHAIQDLAKIHINTLYPVVWNWGYTSYPSPTAQAMIGTAVDPRPFGLQGRDVLAELVQQGHRLGMAVIPWFEFGFMAPEDSALAIRHPDWLTQRQDGTITWQEGIYPRVWLNPFKPEVQKFILDLILEIVTQYPVDGIQFDDHFGLPHEFGYDPFTVQLYRQEHRGKVPPSNPKDPEWTRWRATKITDFQERLFRQIKAHRPNVLVSLAPNNYEFAYHYSLQDWHTWQQRGLIEELVLQVYRDNLDSFMAELNAPDVQEARHRIPTAIGILTGLKRRTVPMQQIQAQVQTVRQQKFAGVSFFFYETMWNLVAEPANEPPQERKRQRQAGFRALFPAPAIRAE